MILDMKSLEYLPFCRKLIERMLQMIAASDADLISYSRTKRKRQDNRKHQEANYTSLQGCIQDFAVGFQQETLARFCHLQFRSALRRCRASAGSPPHTSSKRQDTSSITGKETTCYNQSIKQRCLGKHLSHVLSLSTQPSSE